MISFEEFCDIVSSNDPNLGHDNLEEKQYQSSSSKKELLKDMQNSPAPKRSGSKTDLYEKSID